jgi:hypothetical protein
MAQLIYYTVLKGRVAHIVKYAQSPEYATKLFPGSFADPGEASQEFKKVHSGKLEYLTEATFERKTSFLAARYQQDRARLADWNSGKKIGI